MIHNVCLFWQHSGAFMRRQASHPIPVVVIPLTNRGSLVRIAPRPLSLLPPSSLFRTENRSCCFYSHHSPPSRLLRGFSWTTAPSLRPPLRRRLRVSRPGRGALFSACLPSAAAVMSVAGLKKQFHKATQVSGSVVFSGFRGSCARRLHPDPEPTCLTPPV